MICFLPKWMSSLSSGISASFFFHQLAGILKVLVLELKCYCLGHQSLVNQAQRFSAAYQCRLETVAAHVKYLAVSLLQFACDHVSDMVP